MEKYKNYVVHIHTDKGVHTVEYEFYQEGVEALMKRGDIIERIYIHVSEEDEFITLGCDSTEHFNSINEIRVESSEVYNTTSIISTTNIDNIDSIEFSDNFAKSIIEDWNTTDSKYGYKIGDKVSLAQYIEVGTYFDRNNDGIAYTENMKAFVLENPFTIFVINNICNDGTIQLENCKYHWLENWLEKVY